MKRLSLKVIALICCLALLLSLAGCRETEPSGSSGGRQYGTGTKPEGGLIPDPTYVTDPTSGPTVSPSWNNTGYIPTSDTLTYPDHVATVEEVHPAHTPGNVKGSQAVSLLSAVEMDILHHTITNYADVELLFENPEDYGFDIKEVSWSGDSSPDGYDGEKAFYQEQVDRLLTIDYNTLTGDDRIAYEKMLYDCEECVYQYSYTAFQYYTMIFNFLVGPQSEILFIMDIFTFDTVEDAENYILLIKDTDNYFDEMCEYEETRASLGFASSDKSYEEAAKSFDNLVAQKDDCFLYESFEERLDNIKGLSDSDRNRLISEHEKAMKECVFAEFEECAARMRALEGSGGVDTGLCNYRGGDAYYAMLTRQSTNNIASVDEGIKALDAKINNVYSGFMDIITSGFGWYSEYLNHSYSKGDAQDNLEFLYDAIKDDFPKIPSHDYYLLDVPEVFEEYFSPAAYLGYHLDNSDDNLIIVNNGNVDENFGTTVAHEGYPGHMFQSLYTRAHTDHPYLYLFESIGYAEGWATYSQYYSMKYFSDNGEVTDAMTLVADEVILALLVSTRADYGIHVENWSMKDCLDYFKSFGFSVSEDDFAKYYLLIVTDPGYYVKYGMGYLWTEKTLADMHAKYPNATDKDIHTAYLDSLPVTFDKISKNMDTLLG